VRRSPLIILALALPPTVFSLSSAIQYFQALCDIPVRTWSLLPTESHGVRPLLCSTAVRLASAVQSFGAIFASPRSCRLLGTSA